MNQGGNQHLHGRGCHFLAPGKCCRGLPVCGCGDRYGQFSSANAMLSSIGIVLGNALCGWFIDAVGDYRWLLAWQGVFFTLTLIPLFFTWRGWHRHGGPDKYRPPMPEPAMSSTP